MWPEVRTALRSLTVRGRGFLAGGATALACGLVLGERDLVRIGLLIALVPLLSAAWVARSGHRLGLRRTPSARQVEVGQTARVRLELTNLGRATPALLVEEDLPGALGTSPRLVVDQMRRGWHRRAEYAVHGHRRGRFPLGPLRLRIGDPFGMVEVLRVFPGTTPLVVTPRVVPLPVAGRQQSRGGAGDHRPRAFSSGSAADVAVREYRRGDDLRRVHWGSTAHAGELMVRREEQPWETRCTLLVDNRARAHRGTGPGSSLETAVSLAASVALHLTRHGYQVRVVSAAGAEHPQEWHQGLPTGEVQVLLERLALLPTIGAVHLNDEWVDETTTPGMLVAVLGSLDDHDLAVLARLRSGSSRPSACRAAVLDVGQWSGRPDAQVPCRGEVLQSRGWRTTTVTPTTSFTAAWQELQR